MQDIPIIRGETMPKNRESVDEVITAVPGEWKFDEQVTQHFDSHVRKSVPLYDEVQRMVIEVSEWFIRDNSVVYDLGSSTGETISLLLEKHSNKKNVRFIGIENSISMIEAARKKCNSENVQFLHQDVAELAEFFDADFVTSIYTFQFLPLKNRRKVLQRIHKDLSEGGALVMVEKIRAENSFFEDLWLELYWDLKQKQGLNSAQVIQKANSLRGVLMPLTLTENINLLREVGFFSIDTFMKWYNFAGIIAVKLGRSKLKEAEINEKREIEKHRH
jgi:tRNA (cmo5U34)-methyltransferase